jgi:hypothetical protein
MRSRAIQTSALLLDDLEVLLLMPAMEVFSLMIWKVPFSTRPGGEQQKV